MADPLLEEPDHAERLAVVDVEHRPEECGLFTERFCEAAEGSGVLWEATPPEPGAGGEKVGGDPVVHPDALHDLVDVDPEAFADVPDLIRERYLGREEGV